MAIRKESKHRQFMFDCRGKGGKVHGRFSGSSTPADAPPRKRRQPRVPDEPADQIDAPAYAATHAKSGESWCRVHATKQLA
jgi:hypothetical protein